MPNLWAAQWRSHNLKDGRVRHLIHENYLPKLFRTRREGRGDISDRYSYIKYRADLRREPHGWRMPVPIKASVVIAKQKEQSDGCKVQSRISVVIIYKEDRGEQ